MTTVDLAYREMLRKEFAELLDLNATELTDQVRLRDEVPMDSLTLMRVLSWAESRGGAIDARNGWPQTVGEVLTQLDDSIKRGMSFTVTRGGEQIHIGPQPAAGAVDPMAPVLGTRAFRLEHIAPDDMGFLYALSVNPQTCFRWRYKGAPPPYDKFLADLWSQVLVQFVVHHLDDNDRAGLVVAYNPSPTMSHVYVGAIFQPRYMGTGLAAQAVSVFVRSLFHLFPLRKVYLEIPGFNWPQLASGEGRDFQLEGQLRDHYYYGGRHWDQYLAAIYPASR